MNVPSQSDLRIGILDEIKGIASALLPQQPNCTIKIFAEEQTMI